MTEQQLAYKQLTDTHCSGSHLNSHFKESPRQKRPRISPGQLASIIEAMRSPGEPAQEPQGPAMETVIDAIRENRSKQR